MIDPVLKNVSEIMSDGRERTLTDIVNATKPKLRAATVLPVINAMVVKKLVDRSYIDAGIPGYVLNSDLESLNGMALYQTRTDRVKLILSLVRRGPVKREEIKVGLGVSERTIARDIRYLREAGHIHARGKARNTMWYFGPKQVAA